MPASIRSIPGKLSSSGLLQVHVVNVQNNFPIQNARVTITRSGEPSASPEQLTTNASGQTGEVSLAAPPLEYSLRPDENRPYADYNITVEAPGFRPAMIEGTEVLPEATAIQPVRLEPESDSMPEENPMIATVYTAIPRVAADGIYGPATAAAVREFQSIFGLPPTGVTDFATWYKVSHIYVAVSGIGELYGA